MEKRRVTVIGRPITKEEEDERYGKRIVEVGKCFRQGTHLFQQHENFVLHINDEDKNSFLINKLHPAVLNDRVEREAITEIEPIEFENALSNIIIELKDIIKSKS